MSVLDNSALAKYKITPGSKSVNVTGISGLSASPLNNSALEKYMNRGTSPLTAVEKPEVKKPLISVKPTTDTSTFNIDPVFKSKVSQLIQLAADEGIEIGISSALRDAAKQNSLYAKGRTQKGSIVTNARYGDSYHNWGLAVDFYIKNKKDKYDKATMKRVGELAKSIGLRWGGDFKSIYDAPHIEMGSLKQLKSQYASPDDYIRTWDKLYGAPERTAASEAISPENIREAAKAVPDKYIEKEIEQPPVVKAIGEAGKAIAKAIPEKPYLPLLAEVIPALKVATPIKATFDFEDFRKDHPVAAEFFLGLPGYQRLIPLFNSKAAQAAIAESPRAKLTLGEGRSGKLAEEFGEKPMEPKEVSLSRADVVGTAGAFAGYAALWAMAGPGIEKAGEAVASRPLIAKAMSGVLSKPALKNFYLETLKDIVISEGVVGYEEAVDWKSIDNMLSRMKYEFLVNAVFDAVLFGGGGALKRLAMGKVTAGSVAKAVKSAANSSLSGSGLDTRTLRMIADEAGDNIDLTLKEQLTKPKTIVFKQQGIKGAGYQPQPKLTGMGALQMAAIDAGYKPDLRLSQALKGIRQTAEDSVRLNGMDGGSTLHVAGLATPTKGYLVVVDPDRGVVMPESEFSVEAMEKFITDNIDILKQPNKFVGTWTDQGNVYLDVSTRIGKLEEALKAGQANGQLAIWDIKGQRSIDTPVRVSEFQPTAEQIPTVPKVEEAAPAPSVAPETKEIAKVDKYVEAPKKSLTGEMVAPERAVEKAPAETVAKITRKPTTSYSPEELLDRADKLTKLLFPIDLGLFGRKQLKKHAELIADLRAKGINKASLDEIQRLVKAFDELQDLRIQHKAEVKKILTTQRERRIKEVAEAKAKGAEALAAYKAAQREKRIDKRQKDTLMRSIKGLSQTRIKDPKLLKLRDSLVGTIDTAAQTMRASTELNLRAAQQTLDELRAKGEYVDPDIEAKIARLNKRRIGEMSQDELDELAKTVDEIRGAIETSNKALSLAEAVDISDAIKEVTGEISRKAKPKAEFKTVGQFKRGASDLLGRHSQTLRTLVADILNSNENNVGWKVYRRLDKAQSDKFAVLRDVENWVKENYGFDFRREVRDTPIKKKIVRTFENGKVPMTDDEYISLYLLSRQPKFRNGLTKGGFRTGNRASAIKLTEADLNNLKLDDRGEKIVKAWDEYVEKFSRPEIDKVYQQLYGKSLPQEANYFPGNRDELDITRTITQETPVAEKNLLHPSFTKERNYSDTGMKVYGVFDVWNKHLEQMSDYTKVALPMRDFRRILMDSDVRKALLKRYGSTSLTGRGENSLVMREFEQTLTDLAGGRQTTTNEFEKLAQSILGNIAGAKLKFSASTILMQGASYPLAATYINPKYLAKALGHFAKLDEAYKHSPSLWYRQQYGQTREMLELLQRSTSKTEWMMQWMKNADLNVSSRIWLAAKYQIEASKKYKPGSPEFYEAVDDLFRTAMETQQNSTILQRPGLYRDPGIWSKGLTMFQQPSAAMVNTLTEAWLKAKNTGDARMLVRALGSTAASIALVGGIRGLVADLQNKEVDWDKTIGEAAISSFPVFGDIATSLARGQKLTGGGMLAETLDTMYQGGMSALKLGDKLKKLDDKFTNLSAEEQALQASRYEAERFKTIVQALRNIVTPIAEAGGMPLANIEKHIRLAAIQSAKLMGTDLDVAAYRYDKQTGKFPTQEQIYDTLIKNKDNDAIVDEIVADLKGRTEPSSVVSAFDTRLADKDKTNDIDEAGAKSILKSIDPKYEPDAHVLEKTKYEYLASVGLNKARVDEARKIKKQNDTKVEAIVALRRAGFSNEEIEKIRAEFWPWKRIDIENSDVYDLVFGGTGGDQYKQEIINNADLTQKGVIASINARNRDDDPENDVSESEAKSTLKRLGLSKDMPETVTDKAKEQILRAQTGLTSDQLSRVKSIEKNKDTKQERYDALVAAGFTKGQISVIMNLYFGYKK